MTPEETLERLGTAATGLSEADIANRRALHGPNALPEKKRRSLLLLFLGQFQSPLIYLLLASAGIAFALGERTDALVILSVVFLNAVIGSYQEGRAARSMDALKRLSGIRVHVRRDGRQRLIDARELVPGDIVLLSAGDAIAADLRLIETASLETAEAALTGESVPVSKNIKAVPEETSLADRTGMAYAGTHATAGRGTGVVVETGLGTEVGKIAVLTQTARESQTPLEQRVAQFGRYIILASLLMFAVVMAVGLLRGLTFAKIFLVAISQVVSMVPEGLPVAMTVALAVGMQRMAKRGAIVRRLSAVETLGSTNVICSDKTGTLTRNEMTVTSLYLPGGRIIEVTGAGYKPEGELRDGDHLLKTEDPGLRDLLLAAIFCNDSQLLPPDTEHPHWRGLGDPTEVALITLAQKAGFDPKTLHARHPRIMEIPFDSSIKMMATEVSDGEIPRIYVKGAPEVVLSLCASVSGEERRRILESEEAMALRALRLLAFAAVDNGGLNPSKGIAQIQGRARFLGLAGQFDPPREEVLHAVRQCRASGIRPVMVTGDHKATGLAVARMLEIAGPHDVAVDDRELSRMSDEELRERLDHISVFARVHPSQKLRIVEAFQAQNAVVAMTGDGVNDAPALAKADVGVAMGITGTEVAKGASKIVITDDNFATIVHAVEEGRLVYRNIKKLILYLVGTGICEILVLFAALLLGYPLPLAAVQILWVNLISDGALTVPLVMDPAEGDEMKQAPIARNEPILTRSMISRLALMAVTMAASTFGYFAWKLHSGVPFAQVQTGTFTVLATCQWFNALNCRSATHSLFSRELWNNFWILGGLAAGNVLNAAVIFTPSLNRLFHTTPLPWPEVFIIGAAASLVIWAEEVRKFFARRKIGEAK